MEKSIYEFSKKLGNLIPRITREIFKKEIKKIIAEDITLSQMVALELLLEKENYMMKDIARDLSISGSAATGLVDRMIRLNFLERVHGTKDRRVVTINITKKGKDIINRIRKKRIDLTTKVFGKLSQRERDTYIKILEKIYGLILAREK